MPASPRKQAPIVRVADTPWGDLPTTENVESLDASIFALPGYSDERTIQELDRAAGENPSPLPYRFQFVRVQRVNGQDDNTKIAEYASRGYRIVKWDEADGLGLNLTSPDGTAQVAATRATDGTVRVGDQLLMVCPAEKVVRHARALAELQRSQFEARVSAPMERAVNEVNTASGYDGRTAGASFQIVEDDPTVK